MGQTPAFPPAPDTPPGGGSGPGRAGRAASRRSVRMQRWRHVGELPLMVLAAILVAMLVKGFILQAFFIPSGSMVPTLQVGDRVVVSRLAYRLGEPEAGDVVVFVRDRPGKPAPPDGPLSWVRRAVAEGFGGAPPGSEDLIKRVIGVPGDVIAARDGHLLRNDVPVDEPYLPPGTRTADFGPVRVLPGHYWVMGDNRDDSADSRVFGQVPRSALVGRAVARVWPLPRVGGL